MSISSTGLYGSATISTGLYGSATIVNTDLFDDVEVLKQDINDTSVNKIPGIILDVSHNKATITYTQA